MEKFLEKRIVRLALNAALCCGALIALILVLGNRNIFPSALPLAFSIIVLFALFYLYCSFDVFQPFYANRTLFTVQQVLFFAVTGLLYGFGIAALSGAISPETMRHSPWAIALAYAVPFGSMLAVFFMQLFSHGKFASSRNISRLFFLIPLLSGVICYFLFVILAYVSAVPLPMLVTGGVIAALTILGIVAYCPPYGRIFPFYRSLYECRAQAIKERIEKAQEEQKAREEKEEKVEKVEEEPPEAIAEFGAVQAEEISEGEESEETLSETTEEAQAPQETLTQELEEAPQEMLEEVPEEAAQEAGLTVEAFFELVSRVFGLMGAPFTDLSLEESAFNAKKNARRKDGEYCLHVDVRFGAQSYDGAAFDDLTEKPFTPNVDALNEFIEEYGEFDLAGICSPLTGEEKATAQQRVEKIVFGLWDAVKVYASYTLNPAPKVYEAGPYQAIQYLKIGKYYGF